MDTVAPGRASMQALLHPRHVAIVGASTSAVRTSGLIVALLARHGFTGEVYPINPRAEQIAGYPAFANVGDLPDVNIDLVVIALAAHHVAEALEQAGARGVRAAVIISSGFAETGSAGGLLQEHVVEIARRYDMAVCGPNVAGLSNFHDGFVAFGTTGFIRREVLPVGPVAILSASGGFGNTLYQYCLDRGLGVGYLIGLGNEAVTSAADYLDALVDDDRVRTVLCFLEQIRRPRAFLAAADRARAAGKTVVVLKGGRSDEGRRAMVSHTAALAGRPELYAAAFRQHGIIQVTDIDELADVAMMLEGLPATPGRRLGIYSLPGGATGLLADLAGDAGLAIPDLEPGVLEELTRILPDYAVPRNPLDATAGFARDSAAFRESLVVFAADPGIDLVVFFPLASDPTYAQQLADDVVAVAPTLGKPIVVIWTATRDLEAGAWATLREHGIPLFVSSRSAMTALAAVTGRSKVRAPADEAGSRDPVRVDGTTTSDVVAALQRSGVGFPFVESVSSADEAAALVARRPGRYVMKVVSADIAHKTEAGGVALDVTGADQAADVFAEMTSACEANVPGCRIDGIELHDQAGDGIELLIGATYDHQLGSVLTVGMGGVFTELLRDTASRLLPVSRRDVHEMLAELSGASLLSGFRGRGAVDVEAVVDVAVGLGAVALSMQEHRPEIELNPVLATTHGALALDVLVVLGS